MKKPLPSFFISTHPAGAAGIFTQEEFSAMQGEETMVTNMNVSKSIADIERRAKAPRQTFETEAWYVSMQPGKSHGKAKDDDLER